jgi:hypothetical protein
MIFQIDPHGGEAENTSPPSFLEQPLRTQFSFLCGEFFNSILAKKRNPFRHGLRSSTGQATALPEDKYPKARAYIKNLSKEVTTFFDFWFENKVWIPLTTNAIESAFSQVKNRIWAVGKRWSESGLMNWLKVVVHMVFYPESWDRLWAKYLDLDSTMKIDLLEVRYQWV